MITGMNIDALSIHAKVDRYGWKLLAEIILPEDNIFEKDEEYEFINMGSGHQTIRIKNAVVLAAFNPVAPQVGIKKGYYLQEVFFSGTHLSVELKPLSESNQTPSGPSGN